MTLTEERVCSIQLARITDRRVFEANDKLEPRVSPLDADFEEFLENEDRGMNWDSEAEKTDSDEVDDDKYDMRLALPKKKKKKDKKNGENSMGKYGEESESEEDGVEIGPAQGPTKMEEANLGDLIQNYAKDKERILEDAVDLEMHEEEEEEKVRRVDSYYNRKDSSDEERERKVDKEKKKAEKREKKRRKEEKRVFRDKLSGEIEKQIEAQAMEISDDEDKTKKPRRDTDRDYSRIAELTTGRRREPENRRERSKSPTFKSPRSRSPESRNKSKRDSRRDERRSDDRRGDDRRNDREKDGENDHKKDHRSNRSSRDEYRSESRENRSRR